MLSYKEYKLLNESLYGAFNLGLKNPNVVAGIVTSSNINGTEAALEAEAEEAIEEAKKMKKKMDCGSEEEDMEKPEDEDSKVSDEEDSEEEEEEEEEDSEDEESEEEEKEEEPKFMKKKAKKEWSEIVADLESFLEDVSEEESLIEIKKGLELIKEGMKKHKKDCDCEKCSHDHKKEDKKDKEDGEDKEAKGLTAAQKKLPKALQDAILAKQGKGKDKGEEKKCGKYMTEEEQTWWNSVNGMLNPNPDQRNWDGMFKTVDSVETAIRDEERPA